MNGERVSWVINQPAPTFCIHVPVYEITAANQSERNSGSRNGSKAAPLVGARIGTVELSESAISLPEFQRERGVVLRKATHGCAMHAPHRGQVQRTGSLQRSEFRGENLCAQLRCKQKQQWRELLGRDRATCGTGAGSLACEPAAR